MLKLVARLYRSRGGKCRFLSSGAAAEQSLKRTALYDYHVEIGGKMVPFAGWEMPTQYRDSIVQSHMNCRERATLFDVSHMAQVTIKGTDQIPFMERCSVADIRNLVTDHATLTVLPNPSGGIIDDCVITRQEKQLYVVLNAGCADKDLKHLNSQLAASKLNVKIERIETHSLLALQGPLAASILQQYVKEDLSRQGFMTGRSMVVNKSIDCHVTRCGYTGEDGFEISVPHKDAVKLAKLLTSNTACAPAGLAVRDSLRLEAGLCLYGNDIDESTSPAEAGLAWTINKRRREEGGFLGADTILKQLKDGTRRKRVGLMLQNGIPRSHMKITTLNGADVGEITSGTFSPVLKRGIAMGYVSSENSKLNTELLVDIRGKQLPAVVTKMPFVKTNYFRTS